jgi:aspartate aminotransferase
MFSYLGISSAQVRALREHHHVYMTDDSRMNIAGLRRENLEYFARAVAQVLASA